MNRDQRKSALGWVLHQAASFGAWYLIILLLGWQGAVLTAGSLILIAGLGMLPARRWWLG